MEHKQRKAPPVLTGYDPRAVERAPFFADGHLPAEDKLSHASDATAPAVKEDDTISPPKAPDGISGDWQ